jgi:hypothetical protein
MRVTIRSHLRRRRRSARPPQRPPKPARSRTGRSGQRAGGASAARGVIVRPKRRFRALASSLPLWPPAPVRAPAAAPGIPRRSQAGCRGSSEPTVEGLSGTDASGGAAPIRPRAFVQARQRGSNVQLLKSGVPRFRPAPVPCLSCPSRSLVRRVQPVHNTGVPYGIRTRVTNVKGWCPGPLDERDSVCAPRVRPKGSGG